MATAPKFQQLFLQQIRNILGKDKNAALTRYEYAKGARILRRSVWNEVKSIFLMLSGITSAAFGLESFLIPTGLIDGGVTGISLLTRSETGISLSILVLVLNLPFIVLGCRHKTHF